MDESQPDYRRVEMLALHDADVVVTPRHYGDAITGWTEWPFVAECWRLPGGTLQKLAEHLGLETHTISRKAWVKGKEKIFAESLRDVEIEIYREIPHSGNGWDFHSGNETQKILWLEVKTPVQPGFLTIRVCLMWDGENGEQETYIRELAYSGSYTIWWTQSREEPLAS